MRRQVLGSRYRNYKYTDGSNRLTALTDANGAQVVSYGYDARGNMTNDGPTQLTYDLADTVTRVNAPSGVENYVYDANGHRIEVSASGGTRYPVYTKDGLLRAEYGAQPETYYYLGSQLIARSRLGTRPDLIFSSGFEALVGSTVMQAVKSFLDKAASSVVVNWYLSDHLGSNIATTDATGAIIERSQFAPFGERWGEAATRGPGYTGHFEDASGYNYMKARYYGGAVGRFVSPDPVGVDVATGGNFNRYWYGGNNPQRFVDPDGRFFQLVGAAVELCAEIPACWIMVSAGVVVAAKPATDYVSERVAARWSSGVVSDLGVASENDYVVHNEGSEGAVAEPGTAESDEGCIYCVRGENTKSGKDYVGSADDLDRRSRDKSDGRDRTDAEKIDSYKKGDRTDRQNKEQQAMNDRGGVENLDNKRNEVAQKKWEDRGIQPPN